MHHHDHSYVDRRGGHVLWSHFRNGVARGAYRRAALEASVRMYRETAGIGDPERGGLALLVLQRAQLAAEDVGRLLHTLAAKPSWERLTRSSYDDLDRIFEQVLSQPRLSTGPFLLPSMQEVADEHFDPTETRGFQRLVRLSEARIEHQLQLVARFWLRYRLVAKATMHGYPIVAGKFFDEPPGAGKLSELARKRPMSGLWALAVPSEANHLAATVATTAIPLNLGDKAVSGLHVAGKAAIKTTGWLCEAQAFTIERGFARTTPLDLVDRLAADERDAVLALFKQRGVEWSGR